MKNSEQFTRWIDEELDKRGWSRSEAARRGEISASMFDKVLGGFSNPGPDFLIGVARAFGITRREVFQRAGVIEPDPPITCAVKEMQAEYVTLNEDDQAAVLRITKALHAGYKPSQE